MKNALSLIIILSFVSFLPEISAQNVSPNFSELRGMEDNQGNTHLLYRINSYYRDSIAETGSNSIYNMVPGTTLDTLYLNDSYTCSIYMGWGATIFDYDYWDNDLSKYIISGDNVNCFEPSPFISRFDSMNVYTDWINITWDIFISKQNDSLVFGLPNLISYDGGFTWDTLELDHQLVSISAINDSVYFSIDYTFNGSMIFKSTNYGNTFAIVDTGGSEWNPQFYYDINKNHIYRTNTLNYPTRSLKRSANQGNAFTWQTIYQTDNNFFVNLDESQSGAVYLADGKKIFYSSDYGSTFSLFNQLDKKILGIYKKPNSNKLYAISKYKIYEITNNSVSIIKSLPVVDELSYYPLKVGNKWIYNYSITDWNMNGNDDIYFREVLSEKVKENGKKYFKILEKYVYAGISDTVYERIDSTEGRVYRYEPNCPDAEQFIEELVLEVSDSTAASRFESCIEHPPTVLASEQGYSLWGFYGMNRNYLSSSLLTSDYNLYSKIGLVNINLSDDNYFKKFILKGMIKNGIVYGDTTLTNVDEEQNITFSYRLEQNYPNPFNPTTKISWQTPKAAHQTLKVFDILGNEVATLVDEFRDAGSYEVEFNSNLGGGRNLSSGVYIYQLRAGEFLHNKKMILLK